MHNLLTKESLIHHYLHKKISVAQIAVLYNCSQNKVNYWLKRYGVVKRTISEAIYQKNNPLGDPFVIKRLRRNSEYFLQGLGLGLYWGEGTKANKNSVRLGNTDPFLIKYFIKFLVANYSINISRLQFGLQIFSDISPNKCLSFWMKNLGVPKKQFYKPTITKSVTGGTYTKKAPHGVLTIHFHNTKLRNILCAELEKLKKMI